MELRDAIAAMKCRTGEAQKEEVTDSHAEHALDLITCNLLLYLVDKEVSTRHARGDPQDHPRRSLMLFGDRGHRFLAALGNYLERPYCAHVVTVILVVAGKILALVSATAKVVLVLAALLALDGFFLPRYRAVVSHVDEPFAQAPIYKVKHVSSPLELNPLELYTKTRRFFKERFSMKAALYVAGRVVVADSHLACFQTLSEDEQNADMESGFYDSETGQFISDNERRVFDDKELYLVRHAQAACPDDPDPDITEEGAEQVRYAACCLLKQNLCGFQGIASPMLRCLRTACILHNLLGIRFTIVPEIMETPPYLKDDEVFKLKNRCDMFPQFEWPCSDEWHVMHETKNDFYGRKTPFYSSAPGSRRPAKDTLHQMPC
jgi:hypothetical protein